MAGRPPPLVLTAYDPAEHELQITCTKMLYRILLPTVTWTAIDHGHSFDRTIGRHGVPIGLLEAQKRKARGIRKGIPDYLYWHVGQCYAVELKTPSGELSDDQKEMLRGLIRNGVKCKVCWSSNLLLDTVVEWGLTRSMRVAA